MSCPDFPRHTSDIEISSFAAWISAPGVDIQIAKAPFPILLPGHVIVKNAAVAMNPIDFKVQRSGSGKYIKQWPAVLGQDTAGTVISVAEDVGNIKPGQRVLAFCLPISSGDWQQGAFQLYTLCNANLCSVIPDWMSFEKACSIPLAVATAAAALFGASMLSLPPPSRNVSTRPEVLLIWGGSSSVGSAAVQLAHAVGFHIFTTASLWNHQLVRGLGATDVFDYEDDLVVDKLTQRLTGQRLAGVFDCIGTGKTTYACSKILASLGGGKIVSVNPMASDLGATSTITKGKGGFRHLEY